MHIESMMYLVARDYTTAELKQAVEILQNIIFVRENIPL